MALVGRRHVWYWVNFVFNRVDHSRVQAVGPDRAAAEWILRLGGAVKFKNWDIWNKDYNYLPSATLHLEAVDATGLAITSNGLEHLDGLAHLEYLSLSHCNYLYDDGLIHLHHVCKTLLHLNLSYCTSISGKGLSHITALRNLQVLNLTGVHAHKEDIVSLQNSLSSCKLIVD